MTAQNKLSLMTIVQFVLIIIIAVLLFRNTYIEQISTEADYLRQQVDEYQSKLDSILIVSHQLIEESTKSHDSLKTINDNVKQILQRQPQILQDEKDALDQASDDRNIDFFRQYINSKSSDSIR